MNAIWQFITNHKHHWGVPHRRPSDNQLIMICYGCGREKKVQVDFEEGGSTYARQEFERGAAQVCD